MIVAAGISAGPDASSLTVRLLCGNDQAAEGALRGV